MKTNHQQLCTAMAILTTIAMLTLAGSARADATLVGHWTFDEGAGDTAFDSSVNGLNGTITNAVYTSGRIGSNALYFNGSNASVEVPNSDLLVPQTIGISLWFKSDSLQDSFADMLDKGHGYGSNPYYAGYVIQYDYDGVSFDGAYGNGSGFYGVGTDNNWADNNWHHLVVNLGEDGCQLYIDTVLVDSTLGQGPLIQNDSNLYFGRHRFLGRYFRGWLDDIHIYDGALSESEVHELFVPEPATLLLLGLGAVMLERRR